MQDIPENARICPKCNQIIFYKHKYNANTAKKNNSICKKCKYETYKEIFKGENNPFYGKHHTEETKDILREQKEGTKLTGEWLEKSRKTIKKAAKIARKNGKNNYERWLKKYGKEEADRLMDECRKKHSKNNSGKGNPMYGKPTPQGSGNGWANWYKGIHFRSLRELMYFILKIEEKGLKSRSGQTKDLRIPYIDNKGAQRTYTADFLVEEKYLIEIKPKKLWNTKIVQIKKEVGERFCEEKGYIYSLVDIKPDSKLLRKKYLNGEIKFVKKYVKRFEKYAKIR